MHNETMDIIEQGGEQIFLGKQPIIDRDNTVVGYELFFRAAETDRADIKRPKAATADVVCKSFAELGLAHALGSQYAFINVDEDFLCDDDAVKLLPKETVLLEIDAAAADLPYLIERCRLLHDYGFQFSVSGLDNASAPIETLLSLASYVKVDIREKSEADLQSILEPLAQRSIGRIASHVESMQAQELCKRVGFHYFQGYFFARPILVSGRKLDAATQSTLRLLKLLNSDADTQELETAFKREPALVANLLRLTNSVAMGLSVRLVSVRQAITVLGRNHIKRWLQLLLFSGKERSVSIHHNPLMQQAALRGYFLELLAQRCYPARRDIGEMGFITGVMSVMPVALGIPMQEILEELSVSNEVAIALLDHQGPLGQLLDLVIRYDDNDIDGTAAALARMGSRLGQQTLNVCLTEAIGWVLNLGSER